MTFIKYRETFILIYVEIYLGSDDRTTVWTYGTKMRNKKQFQTKTKQKL